VSVDDRNISVAFGNGTKKFIYPDAFKQFLVTTDTELQLQVQSDLEEKQQKEEKGIPALNRIPNISKPLKSKRKNKMFERSNIAFKCNFCDGGATQQRVGFNGVCSDMVIRYNINTAKHVWCSDKSCPCREYLDGTITREELISQMAGSGSVCYESTMLRDWRASAGVIQTGVNKGKPMRLLKVQPNSLAILTTRKTDDKEDRRFIFAVFLVDDLFEGDAREEGYVTTRSKWKIELTPQEAQKMLFWRYYLCGNAPEIIKFGSGLHRYVSDNQTVQILRDIVEIKEKQSEKDFAEKFLHHYCTVNGININEVPLPNGALIQRKRRIE
jgi:hypothetical protein